MLKDPIDKMYAHLSMWEVLLFEANEAAGDSTGWILGCKQGGVHPNFFSYVDCQLFCFFLKGADWLRSQPSYTYIVRHMDAVARYPGIKEYLDGDTLPSLGEGYRFIFS